MPCKSGLFAGQKCLFGVVKTPISACKNMGFDLP